jgi:hypothetical protein
MQKLARLPVEGSGARFFTRGMQKRARLAGAPEPRALIHVDAIPSRGSNGPVLHGVRNSSRCPLGTNGDALRTNSVHDSARPA